MPSSKAERVSFAETAGKIPTFEERNASRHLTRHFNGKGVYDKCPQVWSSFHRAGFDEHLASNPDEDLVGMSVRAGMTLFVFMSMASSALAFVGGGSLRVRSVRPMQIAPRMVVGEEFSAAISETINSVDLPAVLLAKSKADELLDEVAVVHI